jgi:hypothetical protein
MKADNNPFECEIRGFWATDNKLLCEKFSKGHIDVLIDHGLTSFPSNSIEWFNDRNTYVVLALKDDIPIAGLRMTRLTVSYLGSIEKALAKIDPRVTENFNNMLFKNPFEISALWNAKSASNLKLPAVISRLGLVLAPLFNSQISLCLMAKYVFHLPKKLGYEIIQEIGNNGLFNYPTEAFQAAVWKNSQIQELKNCNIIDKERILSLRNDLQQTSLEPNTNLLIKYAIQI